MSPTRRDMRESRPWSLGRCEVVKRLTIGGSEVTQIKSVYCEPDSVRTFALKLNNWSPGGGQFPGHFLFTPIPSAFYSDLVGSTAGQIVTPHREYRFSPFAAIRDQNNAFQESEVLPHSDCFCDYVGIISLSNDEDIPASVRSGTSFWRHIPTGLTSMTPEITVEEQSQMFSKSSIASWEQAGYVQHVYNHMIVFPAKIFHRIEFTDASPAMLRLTQNLYMVNA